MRDRARHFLPLPRIKLYTVQTKQLHQRWVMQHPRSRIHNMTEQFPLNFHIIFFLRGKVCPYPACAYNVCCDTSADGTRLGTNALWAGLNAKVSRILYTISLQRICS